MMNVIVIVFNSLRMLWLHTGTSTHMWGVKKNYHQSAIMRSVCVRACVCLCGGKITAQRMQHNSSQWMHVYTIHLTQDICAIVSTHFIANIVIKSHVLSPNIFQSSARTCQHSNSVGFDTPHKMSIGNVTLTEVDCYGNWMLHQHILMMANAKEEALNLMFS